MEVKDFHDEFMSKLDEFSLSWRLAAYNEAKEHHKYTNEKIKI